MTKILTTVPPDLEPLRGAYDSLPNGVDVLDRRQLGSVELLRRLLRASSAYDALLLNGSGRLDQVAAAMIARRRAPVSVIISDATWGMGSGRLDRFVCRVGIRAIDGRRVTYCVLSSDEVDSMPRTWGVERDRVVFTPFCYTLPKSALEQPTAGNGGVFAGGDSLRDYSPLLEAARHLSVPVTIATASSGLVNSSSLPSNVTAAPVTHSRFIQMMRDAAVVAVPLRGNTERSAGQQTYLNAMALGKPVVVTDAPGVRDYIEDRETGLIVPPGDGNAMARGLEAALDPTSREIGARARETVLRRFSPLQHLAALLNVVDRVVDQPA